MTIPSDRGLTAAQLDDRYNLDGDGEHPTLTRKAWRVAVANETTLAGYWDWVAYKLNTPDAPTAAATETAPCTTAQAAPPDQHHGPVHTLTPIGAQVMLLSLGQHLRALLRPAPTDADTARARQALAHLDSLGRIAVGAEPEAADHVVAVRTRAQGDRRLRDVALNGRVIVEGLHFTEANVVANWLQEALGPRVQRINEPGVTDVGNPVPVPQATTASAQARLTELAVELQDRLIKGEYVSLTKNVHALAIGLRRLGFGTDHDISGANVVDLISAHWSEWLGAYAPTPVTVRDRLYNVLARLVDAMKGEPNDAVRDAYEQLCSAIALMDNGED